MQKADLPFSLALASAGKSSAARMAMIAMTTSNSIRVKPERARLFANADSEYFFMSGPLSIFSGIEQFSQFLPENIHQET